MTVAKENCTAHCFMQRDSVCSHYSHSTNNFVVALEPTYIWNLLILMPVSTSRTSPFRIRNNPWSMQLKYWWMNVCACGGRQKCTYTSVSTGQWNLQANGSTITRPLSLSNMSGLERLSVMNGSWISGWGGQTQHI